MSTAFDKPTNSSARFQNLESVCEISEKASNPTRKQKSADATLEILHELSQPLTAINSYGAAAMSSLDASSATTDDLQRFRSSLQKMINASNLAAGIITRFRDATQGLIKLQTHSKDIQEIVTNAVEMLAFPIQEKGIEIRYDVISAKVDADSVRIQEVLINLIRNSLEAVAEDIGSIEIAITKRTGYVKVSISDNGPGVIDSAHGNLFHPITSRKPHGMGIGLAVSKSIIESHGGEIWYSNNAPSGARFQFTLPIPLVARV